MKYRQLGRTGLQVSEISIGTEWLYKKRQEDVRVLIEEAIARGVNYFDISFNFEPFLQQLSSGIKPSRDKVLLTHHLGSSEYKRRYRKTRSIAECRRNLERFLTIMETDHTAILFIHFVHTGKDYEKVLQEGGVKDLALELKKEGKARCIGASTHHAEQAIEFAQSGIADLVMTQINLANHSSFRRKEFLETCASTGTGVIAMKPFAGGRLLRKERTVAFASYHTASHSVGKKKMPAEITPQRCLHYVLSLPGISAAVPGVANLGELEDCLSYYSASEEEKDYSGLLKGFQEYNSGECVYFNHCLPCPSGIDIGPMIRLYDMRDYLAPGQLRKEYSSFENRAGCCSQCGVCMERCPFDVDVIAKLREIDRYLCSEGDVHQACNRG
ncbi:MAG: aldo/keto reductase [Dehalococcoidia bacterium]